MTPAEQEYLRRYRLTHQKERAAYRRAYNASHQGQNKAARKAWGLANRDKLRMNQRRYRLKNLPVVRERKRLYERAHPEQRNAKWAKRHAAELRAMPRWANTEAIKAIYAEATRLTRESGIVYHVDHIYPLRGATVCGLHVEHNLQILTGIENRRKRNIHPDQIAA